MAGLIVTGVLTALFVLIAISCFAQREGRRAQKKNAVYLSAALLWVGLICGGLFLVMAWLATMDEDAGLLTMLCFDSFVLLGLVMMLGWRNCYIVYDRQGFTQHNILGMQRSFTYDQLTGYRFSDRHSDIRLYACGKTVAVDMMAANSIAFLAEARKGYARCNHGTELPNMWKEKRKTEKESGKGSFSAHVHNPGEFVAVFIMLMVLVVGTFLFVCVGGFSPITMEDCQMQTVAFYKWETDEDTLVLWADGVEDCFKIDGYGEYLTEFEDLTAKCDAKTQFTVYTEHYEPDDGTPYHAIRELSAGGVTYRSMEQTNQYVREGVGPIAALFGGMLVFFLAFSWLTYKIGCNPGKYPKWLVYCFFKKSAISF